MQLENLVGFHFGVSKRKERKGRKGRKDREGRDGMGRGGICEASSI